MEALGRDRLPRMLPVEESPLPLDEPRLPLPVEEALIRLRPVVQIKLNTHRKRLGNLQA
jgi:hypothetical protein